MLSVRVYNCVLLLCLQLNMCCTHACFVALDPVDSCGNGLCLQNVLIILLSLHIHLLLRTYLAHKLAPIQGLSLIHISEPTRQAEISYAVCRRGNLTQLILVV
eukprot:TRINITY_DN36317_c0_g1_i1.p1 TRINITY_DN36317_c0_g1~~TRINITY_DN36317_c0_g1_i1.p1  ORF type:complete len:103 (+),score=0.98 TRINITY_DN36317_c0_g1_i1:406-714(+)